jgi:hypothetical protein
MNAEEARQLSDAALKGPAIESFIETLETEIRQAAKKGRREIRPWECLAKLRMMDPTMEIRDAIQRHFVAQGFTWKDHPNSDPGHPCSHPYSTLSW